MSTIKCLVWGSARRPPAFRMRAHARNLDRPGCVVWEAVQRLAARRGGVSPTRAPYQSKLTPPDHLAGSQVEVSMTGIGSIPGFAAIRVLLRSARAFVLLSVLVATAIGAAAGLMIWHTRQTAFDEHRRGMASMGVVLAEQTARYVQIIDLVVQEVTAESANLSIETPADFQYRLGTSEFQAYLAGRVNHVPQAGAIALIDADGQLLNSSRGWPVTHINASGRDYYHYFKEHDEPGVFIGSLGKARSTGSLSLFFARRVNGPENRLLGLVLAVVDIKYLNDFYEAASARRGEAGHTSAS